MEDQNKETRVSIINAISKPIQLAALVVLIVEGLLAFLLSKAETDNITLYVSLMVGVLVLTIAGVFFLHYQELRIRQAQTIPATGVAESGNRKYKWDVFLAAPMAALSNEDFKTSNLKIIEIKKTLITECGFQSVFYAGDNMEDQEHFDSADISIDTDINAIKDSQYFVLVFPEKIVSSVLLEAGIAMALGKPSVYFSNPQNLPFLMREANNKFDFVKIHSVNHLDDILVFLRKNKSRIFDFT